MREILTPSGSLIERTEMKRKIYLSEAWILLWIWLKSPDVEQERVNAQKIMQVNNILLLVQNCWWWVLMCLIHKWHHQHGRMAWQSIWPIQYYQKVL